MAEATLRFSGPFRDWIGEHTLTLTWEGTLRVRDLWNRLAADYPALGAKLPPEGLQEEAMSQVVAVIMDGDILTLDAAIRDGAKVDILTPLSGGAPGSSSHPRRHTHHPREGSPTGPESWSRSVTTTGPQISG